MSTLAILIPLSLIALIYLVNCQLGGLVPDPPVGVTTAPAPPVRLAEPEEVAPTILLPRADEDEVLPAAAKVANRPDLTSFIPSTEATVRRR